MDYEVGDTFHGHKSSSAIDYVAVFEWQCESVIRCAGLRQANRQLKLVKKKGVQDRVPLLLRTTYELDMSRSRPAGGALGFQ